jgi:hypothetical protein
MQWANALTVLLMDTKSNLVSHIKQGLSFLSEYFPVLCINVCTNRQVPSSSAQQRRTIRWTTHERSAFFDRTSYPVNLDFSNLASFLGDFRFQWVGESGEHGIQPVHFNH